MVAVVLRLAYVSHSSIALLVLFVLSSCFATLYQVYWDVVVDWGLLQQNSKNPGLRDNLILKRKYLYHISMVPPPVTLESTSFSFMGTQIHLKSWSQKHSQICKFLNTNLQILIVQWVNVLLRLAWISHNSNPFPLQFQWLESISKLA